MIFEKHANRKYKYENQHFWYCGYNLDTAGKKTAVIKAYIQNQMGYDQMLFVEYTDMFTREPVKKNRR